MNSEPRETHEFVEQAAQKMKSILEQGREAIPICLVRLKDDQVFVLGFEDGGKGKDQAAYAMRVLLQLPEVDYVVFLSDAWMATVEKTQYENLDLSQGVRNIPGCKEAIIASVFGRSRFTEVGYWTYERVDGKLVFSPAMVWQTPDSSEGRFVPNNNPVTGRTQ